MVSEKKNVAFQTHFDIVEFKVLDDLKILKSPDRLAVGVLSMRGLQAVITAKMCPYTIILFNKVSKDHQIARHVVQLRESQRNIFGRLK